MPRKLEVFFLTTMDVALQSSSQFLQLSSGNAGLPYRLRFSAGHRVARQTHSELTGNDLRQVAKNETS